MRLLLLFVALLSITAGAPAATFPAAETPAPSSEVNAAQLYAKHCASCHGKDGRAKTFKAKFNHARDLTDPLWQDEVSDERLFNSIINGRKKMPSYKKKLSAEQINSLVAHVRTLAR